MYWEIKCVCVCVCVCVCICMCVWIYCQMRTKRALPLFNYLPLRIRRGLKMYKVCGDSAFLVLNGISLNVINALLVLSRWYVCMYACIHCMYVCIMYVCMYVLVYVCMYVHMYDCTCVYKYVCMHVCACVCLYVCTHGILCLKQPVYL